MRALLKIQRSEKKKRFEKLQPKLIKEVDEM